MSSNIIKKRGRKPKTIDANTNNSLDTQNNSDKENIIYHIPIKRSEINDSAIETSELFIKSQDTQQEESTDLVSSAIDNINVNKIDTHIITFKNNTRCWWCHHSFDNEPIQLPEDYIKQSFICIGNFCSFPCVKAYNLNTYDTQIQKRDTLINIMYYTYYNKVIKIQCAPHWTTLKEYGGIFTIDEFRNKSNNSEKIYTVLKPPIISRQMQIEESYRIQKLKGVSMDQVSKLYFENDNRLDYIIKRTKKLPTSDLNLESTIGLRRVSP
jgi:hypothetical protein